MKELKEIKQSIAEIMAMPPEDRQKNKTKLLDLRNKKSAVIRNGSKPCEDCGNMPHGMEQPFAVKGKVYWMFEIGCLHCKDHRAQGITREEAVEAWNAGDYLPPKEA